MLGEIMSNKLICVVGARPNFMKMAPIYSALERHQPAISPFLVHTGQHHDSFMKDSFFEQLSLPKPDADLAVNEGSGPQRIANIMLKLEPLLDEIRPNAVLVVGDVDSTLAASLVAHKKNMPLVHVEAGLRSFDRTMPEEMNRILTDQLADLLFTSERKALQNLSKEGVASEKVRFVGNVMIDTLFSHLPKAIPAKNTLNRHFRREIKDYALLTLHRPSNVDDPHALESLLNTITKVGKLLFVVFPIHPRTQKMICEADLNHYLRAPNILAIPPVSYLEMLGLIRSAKFVMTDSGGVQEESTALAVSCLTLRENTERPITLEQGSNVLVGLNPELILQQVECALKSGAKPQKLPEGWDGFASQRIVSTLMEQYYEHQ